MNSTKVYSIEPIAESSTFSFRNFFTGESKKEAKSSFFISSSPDPLESRRNEITSLSKDLKKYGITFTTLTSTSPREKNEKDLALHIASCIRKDPALKRFLLSKKCLPVSDIRKFCNASEEFINKNSSYIISISLLLIGDYKNLQEFILKGMS